MKKIMALLLTGTMAISLLSGCSGNGGTQQQSAGNGSAAASSAASTTPVKIRVSWWGNQVRNDRTVAVLDMYTKDHPNVTFQTEFSDWTGYFDKMATQAASGSLPDILQQDYGYIKQYQNKGQLLNLTPYVQKGTLKLDDVSKSILQSGTINGELCALCLGVNTPVMMYDKEIVQQAGITIGDQITWDEFMKDSKIIYEKTGVKGLIGGDSGTLGMLMRGDGNHIYNDEGTAFGVKDSTVMKEFFTMIKTSMDAGWHISPETLVEKDAAVVETKPIMDKTTWNDYANSNQIAAMDAAAGRELGMTMWPKSADDKTQVQYLKPSQFFCVASTSQCKDESVSVLDFFTNSIEANQILSAERGVPVSEKVAASFKGKLSAIDQQIFDYVDKVTKIATPIDAPRPSAATEVDTKISTLCEEIRYGKTTPDKAAEELFTEGNQILAG